MKWLKSYRWRKWWQEWRISGACRLKTLCPLRLYRFEWIEHIGAIYTNTEPRKIHISIWYVQVQIIRLQNIVSLLFSQFVFIRSACDAEHRTVAHWLLWLKHSRTLENDNVWFRHMRTCFLNKNSCLSTLNWALYESAPIANKIISIYSRSTIENSEIIIVCGGANNETTAYTTISCLNEFKIKTPCDWLSFINDGLPTTTTTTTIATVKWAYRNIFIK